MNLKPEIFGEAEAVPTAFRDAKNLEWKVGNAVLDTSKLEVGQMIQPFTAIRQNAEGNYELVKEEDEEIIGGLITGSQAVRVKDTTVNEMVAGVRKGAFIEERCHGVTDAFKEAVKGRITFDV